MGDKHGRNSSNDESVGYPIGNTDPNKRGLDRQIAKAEAEKAAEGGKHRSTDSD